MSIKKLFLSLFLTFLMPVQFAFAASISIEGGADIWPFGEPNTATYGQTFTVGPDTILTDFSVWLDDYDGETVDFAAYVFAWDGDRASGSALYESAMVSTTNNGGAGGFEMFTFNTGGLELVESLEYIAFISASAYFDGNRGRAIVDGNDSNPYAGGSFEFFNNGKKTNKWTNKKWQSWLDNYDMRLDANFIAPVPEPGTWLMLLLGFLGISVAAKRQRSRSFTT